jgi:hypothetical protein
MKEKTIRNIERRVAETQIAETKNPGLSTRVFAIDSKSALMASS